VVPRPERAADAQPERAGSTPASRIVLPREPQHAGEPATHPQRYPSIGDGYDLALDDGSEVDVSRRQARELRERMAL
jgi:hypothetical protein